ncbi:sugar O-acetyltransferase [Mammaliicoccus sp. Dog046]|uniref:sugar O-acetyltransferase n=1 Tax=Mammaliicoccus sp. Dog046 TaxID=3034233 RepID=UPI002B25F547|nr:sugar O-acetyltransferase [Mammaliicoccus sp. Dog046]WQK84956.1 sugar O-acetyltransferase [Mammaliicoccus sp. Dog046]
MTKDFDYMQMLKGELYLADEIHEENGAKHAKMLAQKINQTPIEDTETIVQLERELFGSTGKHIYVHPPLHVDYGRHVNIGDYFFANMDCIFLDVNEINIGHHVMFGPRVCLYTAGHPTDPTIRNELLEFGLPITIEDNVWVGGNAVILPGVTIGKNAIVASGAVVTKDVPPNTIVGGNPAKVIKQITDEDYEKWSKLKEEYHRKKALYK